MAKKHFYIIISVVAISCIVLITYATAARSPVSDTIPDISTGNLRKTVFALVSSAENSTTDYTEGYSYIEDIDDGRGYTAGIIGFTSGTGDLLMVIEKYVELKPENNILKEYIPALKTVNGTDSHEGLGDPFVEAWENACNDKEMIQAQDYLLDEMYMNPAVDFANADGLSVLGQYIYYDAMVVHGPGDDEDSFNGIRMAAQTKALPPSKGGEEDTYLEAFLAARTIIMQKEEAHSDLSRLNTQQSFLDDQNYNLQLPLQWTMYGDPFYLTQDDLD